MTSNKINTYLKLPSRRDEKWRYSDLKLLEIPDIKASESIRENTFLTEDKNFYYIVLLNGKFSKEKSILPKKGVEIYCSKDKIVNFNKEFWFEDKYQVSQNLGNNDHVVLISINDNIDKPVKLIKLITSNSTFFTTFIRLENNCSVKFYEDFIQQGEHDNFINNVTRINLSDNTNCQHVIQKDFEGEVRFINTLEIICNAYSIYENYSVNAVDRSYRFESEVHLNGKGAKASFYGVNIANNNQAYDIVIDVKHNASNTFSNQHYNQVLDKNSSGSFYSNVEISELISKVEAHQLNKNLLIDEKSVVYSRPMLDINSDDVICSHGSTTGNIDKEVLYYFASRGIKLKYAKKLIIIGLLKSVFLNCKLDALEVEGLYRRIVSNTEFYE